ncbi:low molecular weight protein-tyrosine-phosphatase [Marinagarivorans algicola]|uniref:low molecular weight protein-tyrosine-phosphatase n=1 Tax=Marinagarivorans algicola TaxID=1513270 RepID=UPI0006B93CC8|nr:low molecular weight protein-tyrosine-phosphatase [Marinagarivorans algicola]
MKSQKVLFVCLGNICRSPTAHGVFEQLIARRALGLRIVVDSAGTANWHSGKAPDSRSIQAAHKRGYALNHLRARQVIVQDFDEFDVILAMDNSNLEDLRELCPSHFTGHLGLFLDFAKDRETEVPDPYHGGEEGFERVLDLVEDASEGLLAFLMDKKS